MTLAAINEYKLLMTIVLLQNKTFTCSIHFLEGNNLASGYRNWKTSSFLRAQELVRLKFFVFNYICAFFVP